MNDPFSWQYIPGHFDFPDLYAAMVKSARDGAHFVEIGVMLGRSTCFMAEAIRDSGKVIVFDAIDSFAWPFPSILATGPYATRPQLQVYLPRNAPAFWSTLVAQGSTFQATKYCLERAGIASHVNLFCASGQAHAHNYAKDSLDFVFIDTEHTYDDTFSLLVTYLPRIKPGGVLAGHDFTAEFSGVVQAVRDVLGSAVEIHGRSFVYRKQI
jgi:predicted O-methyltransferase YrrM